MDRLPQELLPAIPPSVACAEVETSTGYQSPCGLSQALSWSSTTPGCTVTSARSLSNPTTLRMYLDTSTTSASPTVWPHCELPAPRGSRGTLASRATSTTSARSVSSRGTTTPTGSI